VFTLIVAVTDALVDVDASLIVELPYGWERVDDPHYGVYYIEYVISKCFHFKIITPVSGNGEYNLWVGILGRFQTLTEFQ